MRTSNWVPYGWHLGCCPSCASADMAWCEISVRAYCNDCGWWNSVNCGNVEEGLKSLKRTQQRNFVQETNMVCFDEIQDEPMANCKVT